ncbi:hypothetical protein VNO77_09620 [Canavalia gladiata]|uniref:Uncharacterized protein n=1 Tax=Canavalia gladiata TaxID=3824 RepID=A0AAN9QX46_CANGL
MRKKNIILKALSLIRRLDIGNGNKRSHVKFKGASKSLSEKHQKAPRGCFSVCVGPEGERFVVKTEYVNHPLFQMLLEDAEQEFGLKIDGPIRLPCNVDLFCKVLAEMDGHHNTKANGFSYFVHRSPAQLFCYTSKAHSAYIATDSELQRLNQFQ